MAWAEAYLHTKWHLDISSRLATIDITGKWGGVLCPVFRGELGPHLTQCCLGRRLLHYQEASWSIQSFGHKRHGSKIGGRAPFFVGMGPIKHNVAWAEVYLLTEKWGPLYLFFTGVGSPLTQCRLGRGLPQYQVASWSIQPFGHNRHWPKIGGGELCPFMRGAGSPSNICAEAYLHTKWHLDPSTHLATIHQCHGQTKQTGQRSDSIGRTVNNISEQHSIEVCKLYKLVHLF